MSAMPSRGVRLATSMLASTKAPYRYIDTHCHLDHIFAKYEYRGRVDGFQKVVSLPDTFDGCVNVYCMPSELSRADWSDQLLNTGVYGAVGIHPHAARHYDAALEETLLKCHQNEKVIAWGECGLDYYRNLSPPDLQKVTFIRQIELAVQLNKPLVVHTRDADADTWDIMQQHVPKNHKVHVHCFTSSAWLATTLLRHFPSLMLGVTGVIYMTKRVPHLAHVIEETPLNRLLLETDGPYLMPKGGRGRCTHMGHIPLIAEKIAAIKNVPVVDVYKACRDNTTELYGI